MQNVTMKVVKDKLMIEIDLSKEFGPSNSGKTIIVGSTGGNAVVDYKDGSFKLGLNCYRKPTTEEAAKIEKAKAK